MLKQNDIEEFANILETNGYSGAMSLVVDDLIPIAKKHRISLLASAKRYANCDEHRDTSFYQLGVTLNKIDPHRLTKFNKKC